MSFIIGMVSKPSLVHPVRRESGRLRSSKNQRNVIHYWHGFKTIIGIPTDPLLSRSRGRKRGNYQAGQFCVGLASAGAADQLDVATFPTNLVGFYECEGPARFEVFADCSSIVIGPDWKHDIQELVIRLTGLCWAS
jgi:hypothetical protein